MKGRETAIKPWMGIFGLFGFMGIMGFFMEPGFLMFFGFFAFFSWYWEGKLSKELQDERLLENRRRALKISYQSGFAFVFSSMVVIGNLWGSNDPAKAYAALNIVISLAFAVSINLSAYLAYKFDRDGCGDE